MEDQAGGVRGDSKGNTKRFKNKLNKVAPHKARTPSPTKTKKAKKVTKNTTLATAKTPQFRGPLFFVETVWCGVVSEYQY